MNTSTASRTLSLSLEECVLLNCGKDMCFVNCVSKKRKVENRAQKLEKKIENSINGADCTYPLRELVKRVDVRGDNFSYDFPFLIRGDGGRVWIKRHQKNAISESIAAHPHSMLAAPPFRRTGRLSRASDG